MGDSGPDQLLPPERSKSFQTSMPRHESFGADAMQNLARSGSYSTTALRTSEPRALLEERSASVRFASDLAISPELQPDRLNPPGTRYGSSGATPLLPWSPRMTTPRSFQPPPSSTLPSSAHLPSAPVSPMPSPSTHGSGRLPISSLATQLEGHLTKFSSKVEELRADVYRPMTPQSARRTIR